MLKFMQKLNSLRLWDVLRGIVLGLGALLVWMLVVMFWSDYSERKTTSGNTQVLQKCPDDYGTDDVGSAEYLAATNKWTNDFYDTHPGATLTDWALARQQFWVDNNCAGAMDRYYQYENINPYDLLI